MPLKCPINADCCSLPCPHETQSVQTPFYKSKHLGHTNEGETLKVIKILQGKNLTMPEIWARLVININDHKEKRRQTELKKIHIQLEDDGKITEQNKSYFLNVNIMEAEKEKKPEKDKVKGVMLVKNRGPTIINHDNVGVYLFDDWDKLFFPLDEKPRWLLSWQNLNNGVFWLLNCFCWPCYRHKIWLSWRNVSMPK